MRARVPLVLQAEPADCGPAAVAMVLGTARPEAARVDTVDALRRRTGRDGMSVADLRRELADGGVPTRALRVHDPALLRTMPGPQILLWEGVHYVVVERYTRRTVHLCDPAFGRRWLSWAAFTEGFAGVAVVPRTDLRADAPRRSGESVVRRMMRLWGRDARRNLLLIALATGLLELLTLGTVVLLRSLLNGSDATLATAVVVALLVIAGAEVAGYALRGVLVARTHTRGEVELRARSFRHVLRLDWSFHARRSAGDTMSRLEFVRDLYDEFFNGFALIAFDALASLATVGLLFTVSVPAGLTVLGVVLACLTVAVLMRQKFTAVATAAVEARTEVGGFTSDVLRAIEGLKGVGGEPAAYRMWQQRLRRLEVATGADRLRMNSLTAVQMGVVRIGQLLVVAIAAVAAGAGLRRGDLVATVSLSGVALTPLLLAVRRYLGWGEMESYLTRLEDLLDREPKARWEPATDPTDPTDADDSTDGTDRRPRFERLSVQDVSFSFGSGSPVLTGVGFALRRGEFLGVTAASGTGKTTLLRIIAGMLEADCGQVRVDGRPMSEATAAGLRCALVPQDVELVTGTIAENLRIAAADATDEELLAACRIAGMEQDLARMPLGLHTRLGSGGSGVSGGQRQRIAIARAVASRPDILLLDEATSALDYATESVILSNLRGHTLVVVTHRTELLAMMDHVVHLTTPAPAPSTDTASSATSVA